ncbi:MAG: ABC transporter ATP-binding protein, partial [Bacilli bacterium]|nr:ABC transporter ATP-binding protein [Bacilli bacterium]
MIEVKNLNKYFNRNKSNQIHVINDTSIKLPKAGLVCLLGASGSGKTTLLNVLGGLDKVDSGEIIFQDYSLKRYQAGKWDEIRSRYFGYVFQNYVLLPELSVYQNLEFVLKMLNLSKEEIDERIEYALKAVGMEKYKKRKPTQLSGGQQQRIAIARALVKSPSVVIADEPTGNLDEKNTTQIMNIIKKISQECLVILVTHERRLAEFYADIIYELADGKIVEERVITAERELFHLDDHNLYLKEFEKEEVEAEDLKIKYFFKEQKPNLNLNIVYKDGIFYINSDQDNLKVQFLDNDSEIKVVDDYKPVIRSESIEKFDYYLPPIGEINKTTKTSFGFGQTLKLAFNQLRGMRRRQKLIYFVFFLSAIMICLGFLNLYLATNVDEDNFLYFNRNLIIVEENSIGSSDEIPDFIENVGGSFALPHPNRIKTDSIEIEFFTQVSGSVWIRAGNSVFPLEAVENPKLVIGSLPVNSNQVAIDKSLVDSMLDSPEFKRSGVYYYEQFL